MSSSRLIAGALAAVLIAVAAGCGLGPGGLGSGGATLTVTRDFGQQPVVQAGEKRVSSSDTVMRFLQRKADVGTSYGGRFVNSIDGIRSRGKAGRRYDWFYYVNGIEASVGAADRDLSAGDHIWWDYHDWSSAMRVPAVVGSYPEPFLHGSDGKRFPIRVDCADDADAFCRQVVNRLDRVGVAASTTAIGAVTGKELLRLVVGRWSDVRRDSAAVQIEDGPQQSGVFARFAPSGDSYELQLLDTGGFTRKTLRAGAGIVAATRFQEQQPTWVVTGVDDAGVAAAVKLLSKRTLHDDFAIARDDEQTIPLPVQGGIN